MMAREFADIDSEFEYRFNRDPYSS